MKQQIKETEQKFQKAIYLTVIILAAASIFIGFCYCLLEEAIR